MSGRTPTRPRLHFFLVDAKTGDLLRCHCMTPETLQQSNMFTGAWETKRTRIRPQQTPMFSVNETFEFGARVRPWLSEAGTPTLELIREDVRTQEEIERDLIREAEALTFPMFVGEALQESADELEREELDNENGHEPPETPVGSVEVTKFSSYRALVTLVREQSVTLWVDGAYRQRYYNQLPLTIQDAQGAGLTATEISAAMQIGEFLGNRERQLAGHTSGVIFDARGADNPRPGDAAISEQAHPLLPVSPQAEPKAPEVVPTRWMEREHIQKRLPYLAEGIARLDEDELVSLAQSISEVLQETYWTLLGITLAHYLDHEQTEREEGATVGQLEPQTA